MKSYIIEGGKKLEGEIKISGSKNASLPIIACSILNQGLTKLYNIPNIHDTQITLKILRILGCKVRKDGSNVEINTKNMKKVDIPEDLMREMRSTVILAGAILGRFKEVTFSYPGGCDIGARPIDLHLKAFEKLGIKIEEESGFIHCKTDEIKPADIHLDFPSVGATENIILATVLSNGTTTISNAAMEPEIEDLAKVLNKMGAKIEGAGTNNIKINGVKKLKTVSYSVMPDRIEAGTFLCATAITGGKINILNVCEEHLKPVLDKLIEMGCKVETTHNSIFLQSPKKLKPIEIKTMPYPGFPTDLQPIFGGMLTVAKGTSVIIENIFENRYKYTQELKRMGAKITIEGKTCIIKGVRKLSGASVNSSDLRGGAALVVSALASKGKSKINNIEYILRGYENLDKKLSSLGAKINIEEV